jgi:hypothetical protein
MTKLGKGNAMAKLSIKVDLKECARNPVVKIDHKKVDLGANRKGDITIEGNLGDGSSHELTLMFQGAAGAKASCTVTCAETQLCQIKESTVSVISEP